MTCFQLIVILQSSQDVAVFRRGPSCRSSSALWTASRSVTSGMSQVAARVYVQVASVPRH